MIAERLAQVTVDDVARVVRQYLQPQRRTDAHAAVPWIFGFLRQLDIPAVRQGGFQRAAPVKVDPNGIVRFLL